MVQSQLQLLGQSFCIRLLKYLVCALYSSADQLCFDIDMFDWLTTMALGDGQKTRTIRHLF